jgi:hypothetical protein
MPEYQKTENPYAPDQIAETEVAPLLEKPHLYIWYILRRANLFLRVKNHLYNALFKNRC